MISHFRLKVDFFTQAALVLLSVALYLFGFGTAAAIGVLVLSLWQTGSALELYLDYRYLNRRTYLMFLIGIVVVSLFLWQFTRWIIGFWALAYIIQTLRDYRIVRRRPKSFWEL